MSVPVASIVISTYNNPDWLTRCLWGYAAQDRHDFELIVADDGSTAETVERIEALRAGLPFAVEHVWQEDRGFRKCAILNRGIEAARADYLIFSDGDCVPRRDFVSQHLRLREPGRYLGGGYCKLPMDISLRIDREVIDAGLHADLDWLRRQGLPRKKRSLKLWARPGWRERLLNATTPTPPRWAGNNASTWKRDLLRVNGFDERMSYGGEDLELGERLANAGVRGKQIRFSAVCIHLDHPRGYVKPEMRAANERIRAATRRGQRTWTDYGLRRTAP
ncbi:glycosyltransferase family 2 protein [Coralloluteibacterium stylophorae]|uniref:Glycosyltransferase family 2 protein n=1 Tax=Coralloluteibacterium stylophorae TaxID=1776034 RepID=A0A8J8AYC9_9GAMM|nr:glycosyltransferase family 2 protein [Coralloluteibacterium stylophorae]MBS7457941.1 glycosyltransferase family 2 protein [Coralloluteibacterium stylophorae]